MTNTKTEGERLVKLEVKVENIEKVVTSMDTKLDDILKEQNNVRLKNVSRGELEAEIRRLELAFEAASKETKQAIEDTKKRHSVSIWVTTTISSIVAIIITLLVTYFIQTIGR